MGTVDGLGEQTCGAGLAGTAWAAEQVGMGEAPLTDGVEQGADHSLLADEVGKGLRAPFSVERVRCHAQDASMQMSEWGRRPLAGAGAGAPAPVALRRLSL